MANPPLIPFQRTQSRGPWPVSLWPAAPLLVATVVFSLGAPGCADKPSASPSGNRSADLVVPQPRAALPVAIQRQVAAGHEEDAAAIEGERLCREFARRKNDSASGANDLLEPASGPPDAAVSRQEADRLEADMILRGRLRIAQVRRQQVGGTASQDPPRFVLVAEGAYASAPIKVRTPDGRVETSQRVAIQDPDILVEVRAGKIHGTRVTVGR